MRRLLFVLVIVVFTMSSGCQSTLDKAEKNVEGGYVQKLLKKMDQYTPTSLDMKKDSKKEEAGQKETATPAVPAEQKYIKPVSRKAPEVKKYSVTIQAEPKDSTVSIMNIDSRYYPGIRLPAGVYDILVQREGYKNYREWINIEYDIILKVILKKRTVAYMARKKAEKDKKLILPKASTQKTKIKPVDVKPKKIIKPVQKKQLTAKPKVVLPSQPEEKTAQSKPEVVSKKAEVISEKVLFPASLLAHKDSINSLRFSPDGSLLASGGYDHTIIIWQVKNGGILHKLNHGDRVKAVCFSPDGNTIASAGSDKLIKLWDIKTGKLQKTLKGHNSRVFSIAFAPKGDKLISGSNNELFIWDVKAGKTDYFIVGDGKLYPMLGPIYAIAFNPKGKDAQGYDFVFTCASGIAFFNTDKKKMEVIKDKVMPHSVTFSPDGKYVAWGARHKHNDSKYFPRIASVDEKTVDDSMTKDNDLAAADRVFFTAFTPDGNRLIMLSYEQAVLYDIKTQSVIKNFKGTSETSVTDAALSPDGHILAATSRNMIRLWKLEK